MAVVDDDEVTGRLALALDMFQTGVDLQRMRIRRQFPREAGEAHAERMRHWLQDRDGHTDPPHLVMRTVGG